MFLLLGWADCVYADSSDGVNQMSLFKTQARNYAEVRDQVIRQGKPKGLRQVVSAFEVGDVYCWTGLLVEKQNGSWRGFTSRDDR